MMSYDAFLLFLNQITGQKKAKVVVQGSVIFIESARKVENWNLSTKIFGTGDKKFPCSLLQCLSASRLLRWQERGAYLKLDTDTNSIFLVQEIVSSKKYLPFKYLIQDFASVANEWREILEEFASRDDSIPRLG
jgi:hypothetical protein